MYAGGAGGQTGCRRRLSGGAAREEMARGEVPWSSGWSWEYGCERERCGCVLWMVAPQVQEVDSAMRAPARTSCVRAQVHTQAEPLRACRLASACEACRSATKLHGEASEVWLSRLSLAAAPNLMKRSEVSAGEDLRVNCESCCWLDA
jgi:hypothetical protein